MKVSNIEVIQLKLAWKQFGVISVGFILFCEALQYSEVLKS